MFSQGPLKQMERIATKCLFSQSQQFILIMIVQIFQVLTFHCLNKLI